MPKLRARYAVKGPKKEPVTYTKCKMNPETKSLEMETVTEDMDTFMVFFPQGHSIRVTSYEKLKELGYHLKPRIVDMETGDVIDRGGDLYDFDNMDNADDIVVMEEDEDTPRPKRQTAKAEA